MGRNGKKVAVFPKIVQFVNDNIGKVVSQNEILLGQPAGRNSEMAYLYKLCKAGYVIPVDDKPIRDGATMFKIVKSFPPNYTSCMLMNELRIINGLPVKLYKRNRYK